MPDSALAAIALGSNLSSRFGDRAQNLRAAIERLRALGTVVASSTLHDTAPVGVLDQPRFLNAAALLETTLAPLDLLHALLAIERTMGRVREDVPAKGPRVIDLDLLFYNALVLSSAQLTLPHPAMAERTFVLAPLAEIAPAWHHPITHQTVMQMMTKLARKP